MKLFYVITGLNVGGAEKQLCDVASRFHHIGHDVTIITLSKILNLQPMHGVRVISLSMNKTIGSVFFSFYTLYKLIHTSKPDIIHAHLFHSIIICRFLKLFFPKIPLVSSLHSNDIGGKFRVFLYKLTENLTDITTNVSDNAVSSYQHMVPKSKGHIRKVYNGINTEIYKHSEFERKRIRSEFGFVNNEFILLAVGRLKSVKNYPMLLNSFKLFLNSNGSARLVIAGDGELYNELVNLSKFLSIEHAVKFIGTRHDIHALMSAADLFVLCSKWEGFGLVIAEAMSTSLPIVATDCGGTKEVIDGYYPLVAVDDEVGFSKAIINIQKNNYSDSYKANARNFIISKYSLSNTISQWIDIYEGLVFKK